MIIGTADPRLPKTGYTQTADAAERPTHSNLAIPLRRDQDRLVETFFTKIKARPAGAHEAAWSGLALLPAFGPAAPPRPPPQHILPAASLSDERPRCAHAASFALSRGNCATPIRSRTSRPTRSRGLRPHPALPPTAAEASELRSTAPPPIGHPKDYDGTSLGARPTPRLAPSENPSTGTACPTDDGRVQGSGVRLIFTEG